MTMVIKLIGICKVIGMVNMIQHLTQIGRTTYFNIDGWKLSRENGKRISGSL